MMNFKNVRISPLCYVVSCVALLLSAPAQASGFRVGLDYGISKLPDVDSACRVAVIINNSLGCETDASDKAFRVYAGYDFTENWGLEAGYLDAGEIKLTISAPGTSLSATDKVKGFILGGSGAYNFSDKFRLIARAGAYFYEENIEGAGISEEENDTAAYVGAALEYSLTENFSLNLRYDFLGIKTDDETGGHLVTLGVGVRF